MRCKCYASNQHFVVIYGAVCISKTKIYDTGTRPYLKTWRFFQRATRSKACLPSFGTKTRRGWSPQDTILERIFYAFSLATQFFSTNQNAKNKRSIILIFFMRCPGCRFSENNYLLIYTFQNLVTLLAKYGIEKSSELDIFFKNGPTPVSFSFFRLFKHTFFTANKCETFGTWVSSHNH